MCIRDRFDRIQDLQKEISATVKFQNKIISPSLSLDDMKLIYDIQGAVDHNALNDAKDLMYIHQRYLDGNAQNAQRILDIVNRKAVSYTHLMRMLKIKECYENPKKKRPRFLDMIPYTIPEEMLEFIERYTDFLEDTYNFISKRLLLITAGLVVIILLIFILVLKLNFLMSLINAALIGLLNYICLLYTSRCV